MAAAELGVFLEQSLLHIEAEVLATRALCVSRLDIRERKFVDLAILEQHVEQRLAAYSGFLAISSSGQTSSILKRLENSISCQRSERLRPAR